MEYVRFGRTELRASRTGFGALPIQRLGADEAGRILRTAVDGGVNFFDTARGYSDSEEKIGLALSGVRDKIILATKSFAHDRKTLLENLETSLRNLKTDRVDILQLHNPKDLPNPEDPEASYAGLLEAREKGMIRFLGITCHRLDNAIAAAESGLYDSIQFPLSAISSDKDLALINLCREKDLGLIAMKALCGGLLTNARAAFAFLRQYENVIPIWGVQRMSELEEFLALEANPPAMDVEMAREIQSTRAELGGNFCRGCGYCMPCPADIPISMAARMSLLLRRAPWRGFTTPEWKEKMRRVNNCVQCGQCAARCPYELDTPALLRTMLEDYENFLVEKGLN